MPSLLPVNHEGEDGYVPSAVRLTKGEIDGGACLDPEVEDLMVEFYQFSRYTSNE